MQVVSIDLFIVPKESAEEFLEQSRVVQGLIKTIPGFVEGFSYEKTNGESEFNFMTTAVWESEAAFQNAGRAIGAEFQRRGYNPQPPFERLRVKRLRSEYNRTPY